MSKSFSGAKVNYNMHDKQLLAIIKALEEWQIFSEATDKPIQVFMDHQNLEYWMQARTFNQRHAQWHIFLSNFNFEIHYCPGKQLDYVDSKSEPKIMLPAKVFANTSTSEEELAITDKIYDAENTPPSIQKAYQDYNWEEDLLWYRGKLVVPDTETLKEWLLKEFHNSPLAGHPGQQRTLELLSQNYWWLGMKSLAKERVKCYPTCQANCQPCVPVISLKPLEVPPFPFHTILYDFITGFPKSQGYDTILVVIDLFSKFGHFIPTTKKVLAKGLAELFVTHIWKLHRLPVKTVLDQGTTFTGKCHDLHWHDMNFYYFPSFF
ncbi:Retrotransposable element Tf2 protein [Rhizoctonia solani]|uniref:Retrotransposable element Tf2 protein n=1 Tax=Rhizoctonia solani TaxID=456999 RepID=A0A8H8NNB2_9AGAM|nr:Retrotransposable element Tf2 protein [Rhizoctonia solani]QRW15585.1 Retrotransposable element Tf2 protein [Rhizoctonia solani]